MIKAISYASDKPTARIRLHWPSASKCALSHGSNSLQKTSIRSKAR